MTGDQMTGGQRLLKVLQVRHLISSSSAGLNKQNNQQEQLDIMKTQISALENAVKNQSRDTANLRKDVHAEFKIVRSEIDRRLRR